MLNPFNPEIDANLVDLGFVCYRTEQQYEVDGDGETGPMVNFCPAYDEYLTADDRIVIDENGQVQVFETRDLEFEAWCDEMAMA